MDQEEYCQLSKKIRHEIVTAKFQYIILFSINGDIYQIHLLIVFLVFEFKYRSLFVHRVLLNKCFHQKINHKTNHLVNRNEWLLSANQIYLLSVSYHYEHVTNVNKIIINCNILYLRIFETLKDTNSFRHDTDHIKYLHGTSRASIKYFNCKFVYGFVTHRILKYVIHIIIDEIIGQVVSQCIIQQHYMSTCQHRYHVRYFGPQCFYVSTLKQNDSNFLH